MAIDAADYHRIALLLNCESVADAIIWADSVIAKAEAPPAALIDLSLGKSKTAAEAAALLEALVKNRRDRAALVSVLKMIAESVRQGRLSAGEAIDRISGFAKNDDSNGDLWIAFVSLAENLSCIRDGAYWTSDVNELRGPCLNAIESFCGANGQPRMTEPPDAMDSR